MIDKKPKRPESAFGARSVANPELEAIYQAQMQEAHKCLTIESRRTEERIAEIEYVSIIQAYRYEQIMDAAANPRKKKEG